MLVLKSLLLFEFICPFLLSLHPCLLYLNKTDHFCLMQKNRQIWYYLAGWLLLNLLQAFFTEITSDEAYYWMYSQHPAWGYFDHPPMIAILIRVGYFLFPCELGVRLFPCLMGTATIYFIYLLAGKPDNVRLFILMICSIILMHLHLAGFLAIPDIPMLFFTALFFLIWRRYLDQDRFIWVLLLSLTITAMFYSKYHSILVIFFTVLANLRLLLRKSFWLIVLFTVILYMPHILWQINHDFITFQYHLIGRNDSEVFKQFYDFFLNQIVVTGPLVGVLLLYLSFTRRTTSTFERVLKFNLLGFYIFFMLSSLKDHVEPHWTAAAFIPMIVLAWPGLTGNRQLKKWFRILALITIPVIAVCRIYLVVDFLPVPVHIQRMFHGKKEWAKQVAHLAGDRPVLFTNKYQLPSLYTYFTGGFAHTRTNIDYRNNQYDLWNFEEQLCGKEVVYFIQKDYPGNDTLRTNQGNFKYVIDTSFCSFNRVKINILNDSLVFRTDTTALIKLEFINPSGKRISFENCSYPSRLFNVYFHGKGNAEHSYYLVEDFTFRDIPAGSSYTTDVLIHTPDSPGKYKLMFGIGSDQDMPGTNGQRRKMLITGNQIIH